MNAALAYPPTQDIFTQYPPPYTLTADMLLTCAFCPVRPLRRVFPNTRFFSFFGRTPLLTWFARFKQIVYQADKRQTGKLGDGQNALYHELAAAAPTWNGTLFVPYLSVDSTLSLRIGRGYGMPKVIDTIQLAEQERRFAMKVGVDEYQSEVQVRRWGQGRLLARAVSLILPCWIGKAEFPSGSQLPARLEAVSRIFPASIQRGKLAVQADWLPSPLPLFPLGVYVEDLVMTLPPPLAEFTERQPLYSNA